MLKNCNDNPEFKPGKIYFQNKAKMKTFQTQNTQRMRHEGKRERERKGEREILRVYHQFFTKRNFKAGTSAEENDSTWKN